MASGSTVAKSACPGARRPTCELTIVVPTYNECANVTLLVERLAQALGDIDWEVIFVDDDSPDGTADAVRALAASDARVRGIRRIGRRGLAGACIEGMLASQSPYLAVMDADLQHDEAVLPTMLNILRAGAHDLVIGSRHLEQVRSDVLSRRRLASSRFGGWLARKALGVGVTDPMSGFFMLRRAVLDRTAHRLATQGFKILADILFSAGATLRIAEVPYRFRPRTYGASKLDAQVVLDFLGLIVAKTSGNRVPVRFVSFVLVGASGIVVHLAALKTTLAMLGLTFGAAQSLATLVAMTSNFLLNNALTYRDRRLRGTAALKGLIAFYAICAIGAVSNVGVANWLYSAEPSWWLAGLAGSIVGAVWNYAVSSTLVWRR
ncbi:MAG TPA: glycosyltransferase family 2 protein [Xanthobacteraceae bacterium]|nr:glycosyltransferase family 2 protein [Xanthobacteraceae bacterium]